MIFKNKVKYLVVLVEREILMVGEIYICFVLWKEMGYGLFGLLVEDKFICFFLLG